MQCHNQQSIPTPNSPFEMDAETTNSGWRKHYRKDWRFARKLVWYGIIQREWQIYYLNTGWQHAANEISTIVPIDFIKQGIQKIFHIIVLRKKVSNVYLSRILKDFMYWMRAINFLLVIQIPDIFLEKEYLITVITMELQCGQNATFGEGSVAIVPPQTTGVVTTGVSKNGAVGILLFLARYQLDVVMGYE